MDSLPTPPVYQSQPSNSNSNRVMPQPINPSLSMQQTYPNTIQPIQRVQPNFAMMVPPPSDYLVWSIANTICSVLFSFWA
jgi:hypothetical protein